MRELHGEREKIPWSKETNLVGEKGGALIECARFGVKRSVRQWEECCKSIEIRGGTPDLVEAMSVGTESTESMKEREPKFLSARKKEHAEPFATSESQRLEPKGYGHYSSEMHGWQMCLVPIIWSASTSRLLVRSDWRLKYVWGWRASHVSDRRCLCSECQSSYNGNVLSDHCKIPH